MRRIRVAVIAAIAGVALLTWAASHAGTALVVDVPEIAPQVIVSLASHEWERLPEAARLARENPKAVVLLTQPVRPSERNCYECASRANRLVALGVPASRIRLLTLRVNNTYDEALAVRAFLRQTGARRVLVVTSRFHTRRALAAFRHALRPLHPSIGVAGAPWAGVRPDRWWDSAYGRWYVTRELAATVYYCFRHPEFVRQVPIRPW